MAQPVHDPVSISIDKKHVSSPNPTTGAALYALGDVAAGYDLFEEVHGKGDDQFVPNDSASITLHPGTHFYSAQSTLNPGKAL